MKRLFFDSETCGLHSMPVLLQYALESGPISLYDIWLRPVGETLDLIEWMLTHCMVGFNLAFDVFHLAKLYTIWRLLPRDWIPVEHIDEIAMLEPQGQNGPCIKPANALDLMLHSRKGPYQSLMARSDIRIRKVPNALAEALADELENRIEFDGIYFARNADPNAPRWRVLDVKDRDDVKDVVLKFNPAGGLKFLAEHALGYKPKYHFEDVELAHKYRPYELGYAPTALAVSSPERNWLVNQDTPPDDELEEDEIDYRRYAWPAVIKRHIDHWATNVPAREYASDDIVYTKELCHHFGDPEPGDDDSILACMVPVVRWRGFDIDVDKAKTLLGKSQAVVDASPININKHNDVRTYISECMDDTETMFIEESTKKAVLKSISNWVIEEAEPCFNCGQAGCSRCHEGVVLPGVHPAARRAKEILNIKFAAKEVELYKKLIVAGKFHASFRVIGTLSTRMAGGDGLNAQGIKKTTEVREMFNLAWPGYELCGGDFDAFEVTLADAVYGDPDMRKALLSGKKLHALFALCLFPNATYEEVIASEGTDNDMYTAGKQGVFAMVYGGDWNTLVRNLGITPEVAKEAFDTWNKWFPQAAKARERTFNAFCSMTQPDGIGSAVIWAEPAEYVESFLGFRRYFTLENQIAGQLFDLARKPPKHWRNCKVKVVRRDRVQYAAGAVASALYGAAFQIQAANQRAAANHEIQSPGGQITKAAQRQVWDHQPAGVNDFVVAPMNIHDEIMCVTHPDHVEPVSQTIRASVESYRDKVPLIGMTWNKSMDNWAGKKSGTVTVKIQPPEMMAA